MYERMKEVAVDVANIAFDTGLSFDALAEYVEKQVAKGKTYEQAMYILKRLKGDNK